ncbi:hypothetical protein PR048_024028 [Dryococelus australis]|uniref:Uncharacterized protein n=1 Tax=Dryococelus australis TaxID=614101 RepID=A0ABQ9GVS7_9NEOP|nr:hypothetical protein PR048_024028 [Dryococelus australis]
MEEFLVAKKVWKRRRESSVVVCAKKEITSNKQIRLNGDGVCRVAKGGEGCGKGEEGCVKGIVGGWKVSGPLILSGPLDQARSSQSSSTALRIKLTHSAKNDAAGRRVFSGIALLTAITFRLCSMLTSLLTSFHPHRLSRDLHLKSPFLFTHSLNIPVPYWLSRRQVTRLPGGDWRMAFPHVPALVATDAILLACRGWSTWYEGLFRLCSVECSVPLRAFIHCGDDPELEGAVDAERDRSLAKANRVQYHDRATPGLSHVGIVPDGAAGRRVISGISRFPITLIPVLLYAHLKRQRKPGTFPGENRAALCRWSEGFRGDLPFIPPLHSGAAPCSSCFTLIGSSDPKSLHSNPIYLHTKRKNPVHKRHHHPAVSSLGLVKYTQQGGAVLLTSSLTRLLYSRVYHFVTRRRRYRRDAAGMQCLGDKKVPENFAISFEDKLDFKTCACKKTNYRILFYLIGEETGASANQQLNEALVNKGLWSLACCQMNPRNFWVSRAEVYISMGTTRSDRPILNGSSAPEILVLASEAVEEPSGASRVASQKYQRHTLDDSAQIADLQGNKKRILYRQILGHTGTSANEQTSEPLGHTVFDTSWRRVAQSSPSTMTADNQSAVDIGILVHKTVESSVQTARVIEASMGRRQNERAGETGDPRENPPTNGIVRHDSHMRKSGDPAGD